MFKRIFKTLTVAFALSAFFAGTATAMRVGDPSSFAVQTSHPIVSEKIAGLSVETQAVRPIVSEKVAGLQLVSQSETPLVSEKVAGLRLSEPTQVAVASGGGFDWNDAGIGAGLMFASLLALSAVALTLRRHGPLAH